MRVLIIHERGLWRVNTGELYVYRRLKFGTVKQP
jgi:hypothetical protein